MATDDIAAVCLVELAPRLGVAAASWMRAALPGRNSFATSPRAQRHLRCFHKDFWNYTEVNRS